MKWISKILWHFSVCILEKVDDLQRNQSIKFTLGISFHISCLGLSSTERRISPTLLFLCLPHRVGGGILEPQTNAFLPWMTLLSGNYHSLEIMWRTHFSSQNRKRGICEVQNLQVNMVEPALSEKEMYSKVKLQDYWNLSTKTFFFLILTITGRNLSKPCYFSAASEYICISYTLFLMTRIKFALMHQCCPRGPLKFYRDISPEIIWFQAECILIMWQLFESL